jgi:hypothetical protein
VACYAGCSYKIPVCFVAIKAHTGFFISTAARTSNVTLFGLLQFRYRVNSIGLDERTEGAVCLRSGSRTRPWRQKPEPVSAIESRFIKAESLEL